MSIDEIFSRGIKEIINESSLKERLKSGKLRLKYGVDPTQPDIHLGHAALLWKLKALQDLGHTIIFLIGDYTAKIGDPSERNTARPVLSDEEIKQNAKTYFEQVGKILDVSQTEIRYNSEWFAKISFAEVIKLAGHFTTAQIIERDDFAKRLKEGSDLGMHELLYPLMQAYDSVMLKADVEFGGTDQRFNMLAGRHLQKKMGQTPQEVVMTDLLVGLDDKAKMSKSAGNYIGIAESPNSMFGKVMSIPDSAIIDYYKLATLLSDEKIAAIYKKSNPRDAKLRLAFEITKLYSGEEKAEAAQEEFIRVFSRKELPKEIETKNISKDEMRLDDLLVEANLAASKSEARRLIEQGAVEIDGKRFDDPNSIIKISDKEILLQVGKRRFLKIVK